MTLTSGARIGAYDVSGPLGAGGMGEVYRARDTKLDRDVALKVLPEAFTADPDRLARFEREARVLASLNHPNIAQIHGLEENDGTQALVLELVEGPTLAERLDQGPLPLDEALSIARQIAAGLQGAHESGVIHRDLKPANVKVRADGTVKVLDFGLAKALDTAAAPAGDPLESPTLTASVTRMGGGPILGTPAYMSPEQAEGQPTDTRGDLWSFGVLLYEMLTRERLFAGESVAQVLARVIDREPDLSTLPPATPPPVRRLLRRCLERDRRRRMRDAGEALSLLEEALSPPAAPERAAAAATPPPLHGWRPRVAWAAAGLAAGCLLAAAAFGILAPASEPPAVRRLTLELTPPMMRGLMPFALSPDGSTLVYVNDNRRSRRLMAHRLDQGVTQPLADTENALDPFFSPDGEWIGFFAGSGPPGTSERMQPRWSLRKAPIRGGAVVTLAENVPAQRASWGDDDRIVLGGLGGLLRVPAAGGTPEAVLPDRAVPALAICSNPHVLPGSRAVLFTEFSAEGRRLKAASLAGGEPRVVAPDVVRATWAPTGHLLFRQTARRREDGLQTVASTLMAVPFDADRLEMTGAPVPVIPDIGSIAWAADGTLLYAADPGENEADARRTLVWVDRDGREEPVSTPPRAYAKPRISPDGDRIALEIATELAEEIAIHDLRRNASNRLTFDVPWNSSPFWSPDSRRVLFTSPRDEGYGLFRKAADGTGQTELLSTSASFRTVSAMSGPETVVVTEIENVTNLADIHVVSLRDGGASEPLLTTPAIEAHPSLSPDGRWIAYQSNETGRWAVYVRPFPNVDDGRWEVSQAIGLQPVWSPDGGELFFLEVTPDRMGFMTAVRYTGEPTFMPSRPVRLFGIPRGIDVGGVFRQWDVAPDGQRFLMLREAGEPREADRGSGSRRSGGSDPLRAPSALAGARELSWVGNWFAELSARVPVP